MKPTINFRIVRDWVEAKELWEKFSPHEVIDDDWNFRLIFAEDVADPYFIVGYCKEEPIGLLALQFNKNEATLHVFGDSWSDDNRVLLSPGFEAYANLFFEQVTLPAKLWPLRYPNKARKEQAFLYTDRYFLDVQPFKSYQDYIYQCWDKDRAKKLERELHSIYRDYEVEVVENNLEDLEVMFALNQKRFGLNSTFISGFQQESYRKLRDRFTPLILTIKVDGVKEAVSFGLLYKDWYIGMNAGVNPDINHLGKYLNFLQIEKVIERGLKGYDAGKGDYGGWKERFKFTAVPQYKLFLNLDPVAEEQLAALQLTA